MKKIYTVLCLSCLGLAVNAQTITRENLPFPGDAYSTLYVTSEDGNWNPGGSGDNQTWDFSGFTGDIIDYNYEVANSISFPAAQLKLGLQSLGESYFAATESDYRLVGVTVQTEIVPYNAVYEDEQIMFKFPMQYLDTFADDAYSEHVDGFVTTERTINSTTTVDGRGTLILANKTYEDVLRVKVFATLTDVVSAFGGSQTVNSTTEEYYFFSEDYKHQLAYFMQVITNAESESEPESFNFIFTFSDPIVLSNNTALNQENSMVYPNPANGFVNFSSESDATIEIFDMQGRSALRTSMNKGLKNINISDLRSGLYNYRITPQSGEVVTGKLTVQ